MELLKEIAVHKTQNTKNNNQTYVHKGFQGIQTGCLGDSVWGTEPNSAQQVWYVGIQ